MDDRPSGQFAKPGIIVTFPAGGEASCGCELSTRATCKGGLGRNQRIEELFDGAQQSHPHLLSRWGFS
jgi:hypothetical protein